MARVVIAEVVLLCAVAFAWPWVAVGALLVLGVAMTMLTYRRRPDRGRAKNWPPGSIGVGSQAMAEPDFYFDNWKRHGSVFKANLFDQPMVCVVGLDAAAELLSDHADSLATAKSTWNRYIPGGLIRWMEGDIHAEHRALLKAALGSPVLAAATPMIQRNVRASLDVLAEESTNGGIAPIAHVERLVFATWAGVFFGISPSDGGFDDLNNAFQVISIEAQRPSRAVQGAIQTVVALMAEVAPTDRTGTMLEAIETQQPGALEQPMTAINLVYLMETTRHDVAGLLMWLLKHGVDHPDYLTKLNELEDSEAEELSGRMTSETLRLEQSEYLHRRARRDIDFRGYVIPKGWLVHICIHESHRDPGVFPRPNEYDPYRFGGSTRSAPFGLDGRRCLGVPLTRAIASIFLRELARYHVTVTADGPRELSAQRHWAPSSQLRVQLRRRV